MNYTLDNGLLFLSEMIFITELIKLPISKNGSVLLMKIKSFANKYPIQIPILLVKKVFLVELLLSLF